MNFKIELDENEYIREELLEKIAQYLADKIYSQNERNLIKNLTDKEINLKKEELLKSFKLDLSKWDKSDIIFHLEQQMTTSWINSIGNKVVSILKQDNDFVGKVANEIIKNKFS